MNAAKELLDALVDNRPSDDKQRGLSFTTEVDDVEIDGGGSDLETSLFDPLDAKATVKWTLVPVLAPWGLRKLEKTVHSATIHTPNGDLSTNHSGLTVEVSSSNDTLPICPTMVSYSPQRRVITVHF